MFYLFCVLSTPYHGLLSSIKLKVYSKLLSETVFCGVGPEGEDLVAPRVD